MQKTSNATKMKKGTTILDIPEDRIKEILKMYFDYVCEELVPRSKIKHITLGKIIEKLKIDQ